MNLVFGVEDHRHAVVKRPHQLVGVGGDDGAALDVTLFAVPAFPESRKGEGAAVPQRDVVGLLLGAGFLPPAEAVCWDEPEAAFESRAEGRFVGPGVGPGIDELVTDDRTKPVSARLSLTRRFSRSGMVAARA
jgi:hypothetical protein